VGRPYKVHSLNRSSLQYLIGSTSYSRLAFFIPALLLALLLSGCSFSLAEDITPPPNYKEPAVEEALPTAASTVFPLVAPDPLQGALIYSEKCLPCHGETGMGDGPMAGNLSNPPSPLGNAELARQARPADWYIIVTEGNLEKFMPGFASLSDRERWDVVAYAQTLSTMPEEDSAGKILYDAECAACHGITGAGDGENASSQGIRPAAWTDHERLVNLSAVDMAQVMAGEKQGHPSFAGKLDETQRYAVAAYVRTLSFASANPAATVNTDGRTSSTDQGAEGSSASESASTIPSTITISGKISNATPGGIVPPATTVQLSAYQGMSLAFDVPGEVKADGTYEVKDVQYGEDIVYFVQVEANGQTFSSDILHSGDITGATADLPVVIYDSTADTAKLRADRLHIFFDFTSPGKIQVVNLFIISNLGNQVVVPAQDEGTVVDFVLPEGAENLQFQDGELGGRFVLTESGFGDRMSIVPGAGQHEVLYVYDLPYERKLTLATKAPLPVDAMVVMVPAGGITLSSAQLVDAGLRDVQGMSFQMYQGSGGLESGDLLELSLSGKANATGTGETGSLKYLFIGLGGFVLALAAGGMWIYHNNQGKLTEVEAAAVVPVEEVETSESILDPIVALDDLHATGDLPETAYKERRAALKSRLAQALKRDQ
jgi:mono/diheme cytochrome c family protein